MRRLKETSGTQKDALMAANRKGDGVYTSRRVLYGEEISATLDGFSYRVSDPSLQIEMLRKLGQEGILVVNLNSPAVSSLFEETKKAVRDVGKPSELAILLSIFYKVGSSLKGRGKDGTLYRVIAEEIIKDMNDAGEVSLDAFLRKEIGVCRHHVGAVAALLLKFKKEGFLDGEVFLNAGLKREPFPHTHAWAEYTSGDRVFVIDVRQEWLGVFTRGGDYKESIASDLKGSKRPKDPPWPYYRCEQWGAKY